VNDNTAVERDIDGQRRKDGFISNWYRHGIHLLEDPFIGKRRSFERRTLGMFINTARIIFRTKYRQDIKLKKWPEELNVTYSWFRRLLKDTGMLLIIYHQLNREGKRAFDRSFKSIKA